MQLPLLLLLLFVWDPEALQQQQQHLLGGICYPRSPGNTKSKCSNSQDKGKYTNVTIGLHIQTNLFPPCHKTEQPEWLLWSVFPLYLLNTEQDVLSVYYGSTATQKATKNVFLMPIFCLFSRLCYCFHWCNVYYWLLSCFCTICLGCLCLSSSLDCIRKASCCCWVTHHWRSETLQKYKYVRLLLECLSTHLVTLGHCTGGILKRNNQILDLFPIFSAVQPAALYYLALSLEPLSHGPQEHRAGVAVPLPRGAIPAQPPTRHWCSQTLRMNLLTASGAMCWGLGTACTPGGTRTTCCGRCEAQFSTVSCVEDRLLVLSNSVEILWLELLCFSYQFLLLFKKVMLLPWQSPNLSLCFLLCCSPNILDLWETYYLQDF